MTSCGHHRTPALDAAGLFDGEKAGLDGMESTAQGHTGVCRSQPFTKVKVSSLNSASRLGVKAPVPDYRTLMVSFH